MNTQSKDQVVLITGGAGGIGAALSRAFTATGAKVAITYYKDKKAADTLVNELQTTGREAIALPYDMSDYAQANTVVKAIVSKWGRLDSLVANAVNWPGLPQGQRSFVNADIQSWAQAVSTNLYGTAALIQKASQQMLAQKYGRIVIISTEIAIAGMAGTTPYSTAKAGIHGLVASLRWEVGPQNILINMVSPGFNLTPRNLGRFPDEVRQQVVAKTPTGRLSRPEDVAPLVVFLASKDNTNITGEFVSAGGGADR